MSRRGGALTYAAWAATAAHEHPLETRVRWTFREVLLPALTAVSVGVSITQVDVELDIEIIRVAAQRAYDERPRDARSTPTPVPI